MKNNLDSLNKISLTDKHLGWLKNVSRTFFLSIKFLPRKFRGIVGYSYILCRFLDIIEDHEEMGLKIKKDTLEIIKDILDEKKEYKNYIDHFKMIEKQHTFNESELKLLHNNKDIFIYFNGFPESLKRIMQKWVGDMAYGMKLYAFSSSSVVNHLKTMDDLDKYTYYVAGTVGGLLTDIYSIGIRNLKKNRELVIPLAINFGKGLQLVNIIKDSRADFRENRCYIPNELFKKFDCEISEFFKMDDAVKLDKNIMLYENLIMDAENFLKDGVKFIKFIPRYYFRIRFACYLPLELANRTLDSLKNNLIEFNRSEKSFKITRKEVKKAIYKSIWKSFLV